MSDHEQTEMSKNDMIWYTILAFYRDMDSIDLQEMATRRTEWVNIQFHTLRNQLKEDMENAAHKAAKEIAGELYWTRFHLDFNIDRIVDTFRSIRQHNQIDC